MALIDAPHDDDAPPRRPLWPVPVAGAIILATVAVAGVITWQAFDGADDTTPELDTAAAAAGLSATVAEIEPGGSEGTPLDACPVDELLGDVAQALGGEPFTGIVEGGQIGVTAFFVGPPEPPFDILVECVATAGDDQLGLTVSAAPRPALAVLRGDPGGWVDLGRTNGGSYSGRCGVDDQCAVLWYDAELLVMFGAGGPAARTLDERRVQAVLAAALPTVVGRLAS